jgi:hypothetical protein
LFAAGLEGFVAAFDLKWPRDHRVQKEGRGNLLGLKIRRNGGGGLIKKIYAAVVH